MVDVSETRSLMRALVRRSLLRAVVVAILLFAASEAHASALTCNNTSGMGLGGDPAFFTDLKIFACEDVQRSYSPSNTSQTFTFDGGFFENTLSFPEGVVHDMTINMSAFLVMPGDEAFLARINSIETPEAFQTSLGDVWEI